MGKWVENSLLDQTLASPSSEGRRGRRRRDAGCPCCSMAAMRLANRGWHRHRQRQILNPLCCSWHPLKSQGHIQIMDPDLHVKGYGEQVSDPERTHCGRQKTILYSISIRLNARWPKPADIYYTCHAEMDKRVCTLKIDWVRIPNGEFLPVR